jgi:hypothetical protein
MAASVWRVGLPQNGVFASRPPRKIPEMAGRALVLFYSQSGETARAARIFAEALGQEGASVTVAEIVPRRPYPYPWRSVRRFFDAMPDVILGLAGEVEPPQLAASDRFDLVVLAYPVWFLSPATPVRSLFAMPEAKVLADTDLVTISVSRAMWQRASIAMKALLAGAGARHTDNIAVTHQGSPLATLVSTPRALLFGKRDRLLGLFPNAGLADDELARLRRLAAIVARRFTGGHRPGEPFLSGEDAVRINRWLAIPEFLAWYCFRGSAYVIRWLGRFGLVFRAIGVWAFAIFLVVLIVVGLPLTLLATFLLSPVINRQLDAYVARLASTVDGAAVSRAGAPAPTGKAAR